MAPARPLVAEALGTALLLVAVVGSGVVVADDPSDAAALFQHAVVIGAALVALVLALAPVSGAHLNPAVTLAAVLLGDLERREAGGYVAAQLVGGVLGTVVANVMFDLPAVALATTERTGPALALGELVATAGLVLVIHGIVRSGAGIPAVAAGVGGWIAGAIVFTSSDAFANPAVAVARTLTDSWTGMAPSGLVWFVPAQVLGAVAAARLAGWLFPVRTVPVDAPASVTSRPV